MPLQTNIVRRVHTQLMHILIALFLVASIGYSQARPEDGGTLSDHVVPSDRPVAKPKPRQGWVLPDGVTLVPNLEYARVDGISLLLDLYLPRDAAGPAPVVMYVHGGAWIAGDKHDRRAVYLVSHGYAVASINYRLSNQAKFPAQIYDCKAAIRWLRANQQIYRLDGAHLGIWGDSAGGHLVALLGASGDVKSLEGTEGNLDQSSRVQAVCDWYGPTDFLVFADQMRKAGMLMLVDPNSEKSALGQLIGGALTANLDKTRAASPLTYVTPDDPPFLIMHGDRDPLVPLAQSILLRDALQKAGVPVTLEIIPGAGHGFGNAAIFDRVAAFFDANLKGTKRP